MAKETFVPRNFSAKSLELIAHANSIITDYQAQGFTLTPRQLYYQFVSRDLIANKQSEYKRIGSIINDARLAGLIDWSSTEDRTRNVHTHNGWDSPQAIMGAVAAQYAERPWETQVHRPEVWIEKDALIGVIEPVCNRWRVPFFACRGNTSQSAQYAAGKRFKALRSQGFRPRVIYLGDHDPTGLDITRDNRDRLSMFARIGIPVDRVALNMDQVEQYDPPPNPAKETDSRFAAYQAEFGDSSWELDALDPVVISDLIEEAITANLDQDAWDSAIQSEELNKETLQAVSDRWDEVVARFGP